MEQDISALIRGVRAGEPEAFNELYRATNRRVYYQVRMLMRDPQDTEDMVQEVYVRLFEKLDTLRDDQAAVAWIDTVTRNLCLTALKQKKRQMFQAEGGEETLELLTEDDKQCLPEEYIDDEESRRLMVELVDALPEAQSQTVYLYYFYDMSVQQIAQELGISEGTVKSRLNTARGKLRVDVNALQRKGIKLFTVAALVALLRRDAQACTVPPELEARVARHLSKLAVPGAGAASTAVTAESTTVASAVGGASSGGAAGAATAAKGMALGVKLLIAAIAATAVVGGGVAVWMTRPPVSVPAPSPTQTQEAQPTQTLPPPTPTPAPEESAAPASFVPEELMGKSIAELKAILGPEGTLSTGGGRDNYNWDTPRVIAATAEGEESILSFMIFADVPLHGLIPGSGAEEIQAAWGDLTFRDGPVSMREMEGMTMYFYEDDLYTYQANVKDGIVQHISLYNKGNP